MKILNKCINLVITFILTIAIAIYVLINLFSSTILNKNYVLAKLDESDYYSNIYEDARSNFENYINQSGLEKTVLENIITEEKIEKDTKIIISNIYDGLNYEIDTQEIKNNLNKNINNEIGNNITESERKSIDTFINKIADEYLTTILHTGYEQKINSIYVKAKNYKVIAVKTLLIIIGVCLILLIALNIRRIYNTISYIGISLCSSGILFVIINIFINAKVKVQNIVILNDTISNILRNVITENINTIFNYGIILGVIGIILIIISSLVDTFKKYEIQKSKYTQED